MSLMSAHSNTCYQHNGSKLAITHQKNCTMPAIKCFCSVPANSQNTTKSYFDSIRRTIIGTGTKKMCFNYFEIAELQHFGSAQTE